MEEPVYVHPRHGGWEKSRAKTCDTGMSTGVNEDIRLNEHECLTDGRGKRTYDFELPVNDI